MSITDTSTEVEGNPDLLDPDAAFLAELGTELSGSDDEVSTDESTEDEDTSELEAADDDLFVVKVDGSEIEVTRDELLAGYSRQADYTKKTQELAHERKELAQLTQLAEALNTDPKGTLQELARAFGVESGNEPAEIEDDFDMDDPIMKELRELKDWKRTIEADRVQSQQANQEAALQREIDSVKATFEVPDLDEDSLLRFAVDNEIHNLSAAYELMSAREAKASQPTADKLAEKRQVPPIDGGSTRKGARRGAGKIGSIADALAATMHEFDG